MSGRRKKAIDRLRRLMTTGAAHPRVFRRWLKRQEPAAPTSARARAVVRASARRAKRFREQQKRA